MERRSESIGVVMFVAYWIVLTTGCATHARKLPGWVSGLVPQYSFVGVSTLQEDEIKATEEAIYNATKRFYEEYFGISIKSEEQMKKSERMAGNKSELVVEYRSNVKAQLFIPKIRFRLRDKFVEKEKGKYRVYVLIGISPDEILRAKNQAASYYSSLVSEAERLVKEARRFELERPQEALLSYRTAGEILSEISDPSLIDSVEVRTKFVTLKSEINAKIEHLESLSTPWGLLNSIKANSEFIDDVVVLDYYTRQERDSYLEVGDKILFRVKMKKPAYIYLLSLWRGEGEVRLLYPNKYDREPVKVKKEFVFPVNSCIEAAAPGGVNYVFVCALSKRVDLDVEKEKMGYREVRGFLKKLKGKRLDVKALKIFIRG